MTLDEIKKLTDLQLGFALALVAGFPGCAELIFSEADKKPKLYSELVTSLDVISEVERIVVDKNHGLYGNYLEQVVDPLAADNLGKLRGNWVTRLTTATARQRAEACLMALREINQA